jgi:UDP-glucose 4-epimerase
MSVVVTGGAGYIGSTVTSALADHGISPVVLDDLSRGPVEFTKGRDFYLGDIADPAIWDAIFAKHEVTAVIHCAGRIDVVESVLDPLGYYETNVAKTTTMLTHLCARGVDRVVFSSSASVYGDATAAEESTSLAPASPYARTKATVEQILADVGEQIRSISLRYFNPIGADPALRTGQYDPNPTHVLGRLLGAARDGKPFHVFGTDWPTRDGSTIRDFIHVWDLALAM